MHTFQVELQMQCMSNRTEILLSDTKSAEATLKEVIKLVLLDLIGSIQVNEVIISILSQTQYFSIHARARCVGDIFPYDVTSLELSIENAVACVLTELFEVIEINYVVICFPFL